MGHNAYEQPPPEPADLVEVVQAETGTEVLLAEAPSVAIVASSRTEVLVD